jgi:hypothetical protein
MLTLYQLADASKRFGNLCHATAHHIAEIMFERVGSVTEAMAFCREGCAYGCQHAVLTAYLRSLPSGAQPDLGRLCPRDPQHTFSLSHSHCTHGIGHGLAHYWNDVRLALAVCEQFPLAWEQRFCTKGVFMEQSFKVASTESPSRNPDRYLDLCRAVEPRFRDDCYYYLIQLVSWAANGATLPMFSACESVAESNRKACYLGIGRAIGGDHVDREDELIRVCRAQGGEHAAYCMLGFAGVVANFVSTDRGFSFCAKISQDVRRPCVHDVGVAVHLRWDDEDTIATECRKAGDSIYVDTCMNAQLDTGDQPTRPR